MRGVGAAFGLAVSWLEAAPDGPPPEGPEKLPPDDEPANVVAVDMSVSRDIVRVAGVMVIMELRTPPPEAPTDLSVTESLPSCMAVPSLNN